MRQFIEEWWPALFALALIAVVIILVFTLGVEREPVAETQTETTDTQKGDSAEPKDFWAVLAEQQPEYSDAKYKCPVDGTELTVPSRIKDNRFGGVASDLMKISLASPETGLGTPKLDVQEWQLMPATCPDTLATFFEVDLFNIERGLFPGASKKLLAWDLALLAPGLAERGPEEWTDDERLLVRYLTLRQAGFPDTELGFAALACAYATNFALWFGKDYRVPSPAYYVLAISHMRRDLEHGLPADSRARAATAMACGELYRLLDRSEDAQQMFNTAHEQDALTEFELQVLNELEGLLESGDRSLNRINVQNLPAPPIGWYLDLMLPAMNGHIAQFRDVYSDIDEPEQILSKILALAE
jgi:hypothetical protein